MRGTASITWRRQECLQGKKDERLKSAYWEKKDGLRRWVEEVEQHHCLAWMCSCSSECVCVIEGQRADRHSQPERPRQSQGSFVIWPICSPTLSAEALVTLTNTCKPSGFPTTAKTIVAHCGWRYKERRKTWAGLTTCPYHSCGSMHKVWSFNLTWKSDINTIATVRSLLTRTADQLLQLLNRSSLTLDTLCKKPKKKEKKNIHTETTDVLVQVGLPRLGWPFHLVDTLDDSTWDQLSPSCFFRCWFIRPQTSNFFGLNLPPSNYRKVSWRCITGLTLTKIQVQKWVRLQSQKPDFLWKKHLLNICINFIEQNTMIGRLTDCSGWMLHYSLNYE